MTELSVERKPGFERQLERLVSKGKDSAKLDAVVEKLKRREMLEPRYRDHKLSGKLEGCRECHIEGDWLLIYQIIKDQLVLLLVSTGSHDDLF